MDTSKEYIKMCNCPEIQEHNIVDGDYYAVQSLVNNPPDEMACIIPKYTAVTFCDYCDKIDDNIVIWLPWQDQLQDMVEDWREGACHILHLHTEFNKFINDQVSVNSMEKLWLAFIMKKKFNKTWHNNKWDSCI